MTRLALALCVVVLLFSCGSKPEALLPDGLVATFEGGEVDVEAFTQALLDLPPARRPAGDTLDESWLEDLVKEIVVDRLLDRQAELTGFEVDPRVLAARAEFERAEIWSAFVRQNLNDAAGLTQSEIRTEFDRQRNEAGRSERRLVSHIFLRRRPDESTADLRRRAGEVRARHLNGEAFARLAEEYSDSESRDRGGSLGKVEKSQLEPAVANIVFRLDEGSTSEPAVTRDGAHLFKVESIEQPPTFVLEDSRDGLARELVAARQQRHVLDRARSLPPPNTAFFVANGEELGALVRAGDGTALVLRHGDYEIRLAALINRAAGKSSLIAELESLALRERVYADFESRIRDQRPEIQSRVQRATELERLKLQRLDGMRRFLGRDDQRLGKYFAANKARFSTPLTLDLERLRVPTNGNEKALVLELGDRLRASPSVDLMELAREFEGSVESLGWVAIDTIRDTAVLRAIASLTPGEATLPRYVDGSVEITVVRDRREPEPRSLAASLEAVRDAFLADFGQNLYSEWRAELLSSARAVVKAPNAEDVLAVLAPPVNARQP